MGGPGRGRIASNHGYRWRGRSRSTVTPNLGVTVTRRSIREYLATQRGRYERASRAERQTLLDEIVAMTAITVRR